MAVHVIEVTEACRISGGSPRVRRVVETVPSCAGSKKRIYRATVLLRSSGLTNRVK